MSGKPLEKFISEVSSMCNCNNYGMGGNNCWWIIILVLLFCCCGNNGNVGGSNCCDHGCC